MNLAYQVYSQVTNQPVFAVIKLAVVPLKTSSKGAWYIVFTFVFILGTIDWYLLGNSF